MSRACGLFTEDFDGVWRLVEHLEDVLAITPSIMFRKILPPTSPLDFSIKWRRVIVASIFTSQNPQAQFGARGFCVSTTGEVTLYHKGDAIPQNTPVYYEIGVLYEYYQPIGIV